MFLHKTTNGTSKGAPSLWVEYKQHHFQRETANKQVVSDHFYKDYAHKTANEYVKYIEIRAHQLYHEIRTKEVSPQEKNLTPLKVSLTSRKPTVKPSLFQTLRK